MLMLFDLNYHHHQSITVHTTITIATTNNFFSILRLDSLYPLRQKVPICRLPFWVVRILSPIEPPQDTQWCKIELNNRLSFFWWYAFGLCFKIFELWYHTNWPKYLNQPLIRHLRRWQGFFRNMARKWIYPKDHVGYEIWKTRQIFTTYNKMAVCKININTEFRVMIMKEVHYIFK